MAQILLPTYKRSVATMSWIDPNVAEWERAKKARLPEFDKMGEPSKTVRRDAIRGGLLYRFANFLEVYVAAIPTKGKIWIGDYGFTSSSGLYLGVSFAGLPSQPFQVKQFVEDSDESHITFRQIVGARTQSPEALAGLVGGKVAEGITELLLSFPPIWTDLRLRVFRDGFYEAQVIRHSLFPSMSFYEGHIFALETSGSVLVQVERMGIRATRRADGVLTHESRTLAAPIMVADDGLHHRVSTYNGVPNYMEWRRRGWGKLKDQDKKGPVGGNPWAAEIGGRLDRDIFNLDGVYDRSGREVPPKETKL
jgi:hypothetical protein